VINANAVLLAVKPASLVASPIGPGEDALSLLSIVEVLALIATAICPSEHTASVHLIIDPIAIILTAICPGVNTHTMYVIIDELSLISGPISPVEPAIAVLLPILVLAFVACAIRPSLLAMPMLLVLSPVALIAGTISVIVLTEAMRLVVLPLALIDISIGVDQAATPVRFVCSPVALIQAAIGPNLHTLAIAQIGLDVPLALITCTILQGHHSAALPPDVFTVLRHRVVVKVTQLLLDGLHELVVIVWLLIVHDEVSTISHLEPVDLLDPLASKCTPPQGLNADQLHHLALCEPLLGFPMSAKVSLVLRFQLVTSCNTTVLEVSLHVNLALTSLRTRCGIVRTTISHLLLLLFRVFYYY
jgi:hypothetical protein